MNSLFPFRIALHLIYGCLFFIALITPLKGETYYEFSQVGRWYKIGWTFTDVYSVGNYLAVAAQTNGWHILDVSNPAAPRRVYTNTIPTYKIKVRGTELLHLPDYSTGFRRYDLSNPFQPVLTGNLPRAEVWAVDFYLDGYLFSKGSFTPGLYSMGPNFVHNERATPLRPEFSTHIAADPPYAYVDHFGSGPTILEWDSGFKKLKSLQHSNIVDMKVDAGRLFIGRTNELLIYDVTNPATPALLGQRRINNSLKSFHVEGDLVYAANSRLELYDVSNPSMIRLAGSINTTGTVHQVAVNGDYIYAADGTNGMVMLQQKKIEAPDYRVLSYTTNVVATVGEDVELSIQDEGWIIRHSWGINFPNETNAVLKFNAVQRSSAGTYVARATLGSGEVKTTPMTLRIRGGLNMTFLVPEPNQDTYRLKVSADNYDMSETLDLPYIKFQHSSDLVNWEGTQLSYIGKTGPFLGKIALLYKIPKGQKAAYYRVIEPE